MGQNKEQDKRILAVILARGGSKGIPRKNIKELAGHPLISYTIAAALNSELVTDLVVSTDDVEIASVSRQYGALTPFMRPDELAQDHVFSRDAVKHAVVATEEFFGKTYDYVVELPCVSPLRNAGDIDEALTRLIETGADSVISVCQMQDKHPVRMKRIVDDQIRDFCSEFPEGEGSRRQDLEPCFIRNGAIYSMRRDTIVVDFTRNGDDSRPFIMPDERSVNIDSMIDFYLAESLIQRGMCDNIPVRIAPETVVEICPSPGKPKLLFSAGYDFMPHMKDYVCENFEAVFAFNAPLETVLQQIADKDAWLCSPCPPYIIDGALMDAAPGLKVIGSPSTGTNHIDLASAADKGIEVFSLGGSPVIEQIHASAEFSFTLLMAMIKKIPHCVTQAAMGVWREREFEFRNIEVNDRTLGLVGCGRIGRKMISFAQGFGINVLVCDPYQTIDAPGVRQVQLDELLGASDMVGIHVKLTEETTGMVDKAFFALMKDGAYFLNSSRGDVVDEDALIEALESGKLKAAAIDVIRNEHLLAKRNLPLIQYAREHDNLLVTPHVAGATLESEYKAAKYIVDKIKGVFKA
jgi:phosphoglycerate dehydrogenase-like enzyme/CMP-N-acetylneuraminic acid synthetase